MGRNILDRAKDKLKEYGGRIQDEAKDIARSTADERVKVTRVLTGVGATAASFIPVVGLVAAPAVAYLGSEANRMNAEQAARHEGESGRDANQEGRREAKRTLFYGLTGAALGAVASLATGAGAAANAQAGAGATGFGTDEAALIAAGGGGSELPGGAAALAAWGTDEAALIAAGSQNALELPGAALKTSNWWETVLGVGEKLVSGGGAVKDFFGGLFGAKPAPPQNQPVGGGKPNMGAPAGAPGSPDATDGNAAAAQNQAAPSRVKGFLIAGGLLAVGLGAAALYKRKAA